MFDPTSLTIFVTASLALLIAPGPAVLYIVARSLEQGRMAGIISTLGIGSAAIVHVVFAALGLSALLMQSALAFGIVKYVGAAYLILLGIRTLTSKTPSNQMQSVQMMTPRQIFSQGFVVNLLNPKTALFFFAFLPQFVDPARGPAVWQIIMLGMIFISLAVVSDSIYALMAGTARQFLAGNALMARLQKYLSGTIYILLGLTVAFSGGNRASQ